jgi:adenosylcobinamide kinase / adenosylcobinamide-phosphate guanylyltransferase
MSVVLVGGGARSGKSRHALELTRACGSHLAFVATAQAGDGEMVERIARHRAERGPEFTTFEEPLDLAGTIRDTAPRFDAILVDCLTLWLSNLMFAGANVDAAWLGLRDALAAAPCRVVLVTNEVGCGIVPENALARQFRDAAGRLNQRVGEVADEVYWMVFGLPLQVKGKVGG